MRVNIIGAGLAGLTAAYYLEQRGHQPHLIERSPSIGGRVKTDVSDGFRLDRGFQVFLTAYPEARRLLDYEALELKEFLPGSGILSEDGKIMEIGDPLRNAAFLWPTVSSPVATMKDKWQTYRLKSQSIAERMEDLFAGREIPTRSYLAERFSEQYINDFFRPFFSGILLEKDLESSARMFRFVFKMFSEGHAAIPAKGMGEIPRQIAGRLTRSQITLNAEVVDIGQDGRLAETADGRAFSADATIIATEGSGLAKKYAPQRVNAAKRSNYTLYFCAEKFPYDKAAILLTPYLEYVNHLCCISKVAPGYASGNKKLIAVSVVPDDARAIPGLARLVREELGRRIDGVWDWEHIRTYHIPYSLPNQNTVDNDMEPESFRIAPNLYLCGDHLLNGSINAAMKTGRLVADAMAGTAIA